MSLTRLFVLAQVVGIKDHHFSYPSCQQCYSKVYADDGRFLCVKCGSSYLPNEVTQRYRLSLVITDGLSQCDITVFGSAIEAYFGCSANTLSRYLAHLTCLLPPHLDMESIMKETLSATFLGHYFLFGFKTRPIRKPPGAGGLQAPVCLVTVLNHSCAPAPSNCYSQVTTAVGSQKIPSLVANQMLPPNGVTDKDKSLQRYDITTVLENLQYRVTGRQAASTSESAIPCHHNQASHFSKLQQSFYGNSSLNSMASISNTTHFSDTALGCSVLNLTCVQPEAQLSFECSLLNGTSCSTASPEAVEQEPADKLVNHINVSTPGALLVTSCNHSAVGIELARNSDQASLLQGLEADFSLPLTDKTWDHLQIFSKASLNGKVMRESDSIIKDNTGAHIEYDCLNESLTVNSEVDGLNESLTVNSEVDHLELPTLHSPEWKDLPVSSITSQKGRDMSFNTIKPGWVGGTTDDNLPPAAPAAQPCDFGRTEDPDATQLNTSELSDSILMLACRSHAIPGQSTCTKPPSGHDINADNFANYKNNVEDNLDSSDDADSFLLLSGNNQLPAMLITRDIEHQHCEPGSLNEQGEDPLYGNNSSEESDSDSILLAAGNEDPDFTAARGVSTQNNSPAVLADTETRMDISVKDEPYSEGLESFLNIVPVQHLSQKRKIPYSPSVTQGENIKMIRGNPIVTRNMSCTLQNKLGKGVCSELNRMPSRITLDSSKDALDDASREVTQAAWSTAVDMPYSEDLDAFLDEFDKSLDIGNLLSPKAVQDPRFVHGHCSPHTGIENGAPGETDPTSQSATSEPTTLTQQQEAAYSEDWGGILESGDDGPDSSHDSTCTSVAAQKSTSHHDLVCTGVAQKSTPNQDSICASVEHKSVSSQDLVSTHTTEKLILRINTISDQSHSRTHKLSTGSSLRSSGESVQACIFVAESSRKKVSFRRDTSSVKAPHVSKEKISDDIKNDTFSTSEVVDNGNQFQSLLPERKDCRPIIPVSLVSEDNNEPSVTENISSCRPIIPVSLISEDNNEPSVTESISICRPIIPVSLISEDNNEPSVTESISSCRPIIPVSLISEDSNEPSVTESISSCRPIIPVSLISEDNNEPSVTESISSCRPIIPVSLVSEDSNEPSVTESISSCRPIIPVSLVSEDNNEPSVTESISSCRPIIPVSLISEDNNEPSVTESISSTSSDGSQELFDESVASGVVLSDDMFDSDDNIDFLNSTDAEGKVLAVEDNVFSEDLFGDCYSPSGQENDGNNSDMPEVKDKPCSGQPREENKGKNVRFLPEHNLIATQMIDDIDEQMKYTPAPSYGRCRKMSCLKSRSHSKGAENATLYSSTQRFLSVSPVVKSEMYEESWQDSIGSQDLFSPSPVNQNITSKLPKQSTPLSCILHTSRTQNGRNISVSVSERCENCSDIDSQDDMFGNSSQESLSSHNNQENRCHCSQSDSGDPYQGAPLHLAQIKPTAEAQQNFDYADSEDLFCDTSWEVDICRKLF